jgi:hypothetical protein
MADISPATKLRTETGQPIQHCSILGKSFIFAIAVGLLFLLCGACMGDNNANANANNGGGRGGNPGTMNQKPGLAFNQQPPPMAQPQMDWAPVESGWDSGLSEVEM